MGKTELMQYVENLVERKEFPEFKAGDTITVHYKIKEGNKERIQNFQGVVLQRSGSGATETFTVRKIANGVGVEGEETLVDCPLRYAWNKEASPQKDAFFFVLLHKKLYLCSGKEYNSCCASDR